MILLPVVTSVSFLNFSTVFTQPVFQPPSALHHALSLLCLGHTIHFAAWNTCFPFSAVVVGGACCFNKL